MVVAGSSRATRLRCGKLVETLAVQVYVIGEVVVWVVLRTPYRIAALAISLRRVDHSAGWRLSKASCHNPRHDGDQKFATRSSVDR